MTLSFCLFFSVFSTCFCSMCVLSNWQTDRCGDVSSFSPFLLPPFLIPSLSETPVKAAVEKQARETENWGEAGSAKDGKGKSLLLWQRTQPGSGQEKWAAEMGALKPSEMFCSVFPPSHNYVNGTGDVLSLCGILLDFSVDSLLHLPATNFWLSACRLLSLKLLSYCCLRPKILLPWHTICNSHEINVCSSSKTIHRSKSILDRTSMN